MRFRPLLLLPLLALAVLPVAPDVDPSAGGDSAMRAFLDPETGRLRPPTAEEHREFAPQRARAVLEDTQVRIERRNGMTIAHMPPSRDTHLHAQVDERGGVRVTHEGHGHE